MGRIVVSCYRPKPGQQDALRALVREHVTLRAIGLVTSRPPIAMEAKNGTIVEVFEWASPEAIQAAHSHPVVLEMWKEYGKVCEYVPISELPEASQLFSEFSPVEVSA